MSVIADKVGCSDLPDALRFMAEQGPATYGMELVETALNEAAAKIEALESDLRWVARTNRLRFDVV